MKRRSVITGVAAASLSSVAGCSAVETAMGNQYIDEHRWNEDDELVIVFQEDHDTDGWAILHEHHSSIDDAIMSGESPDFTGPLTLDLIREIGDDDYPSYNFDLKLYEGWFGPMMRTAEEELGSYSFEVPEDKVPDTVISG
ncbi:hypothetical protein [Natronorubrum aibiense]|uniref:Uncharacterized protein n=1 Tax=Natronorubrum aibiense TaxID=348826 RepID=A0A5P9P0K9_9EURY|nr:hypothetical protein [Natronorubrum aibiense]QFU81672.1 hypothetical protein GCU68_03395 [Natronorubrum aibiense]